VKKNVNKMTVTLLPYQLLQLKNKKSKRLKKNWKDQPIITSFKIESAKYKKINTGF